VKRAGMTFVAIVATVVLALPATAQLSLTWTAGAVGGGWYAISGGMAELLREKAQLTVKVIPGGGTQNPVLVQKGDAEIGMGLPPLLDAAMKGEDPYQGHKMPDLRALAGNMRLNTFHFYVGAVTPYATMTMEEIFKGKKPMRRAISKPGYSAGWGFEKVMEHYGLSYKDWEAAGARFFRGSYTEQAGAFKDWNTDGALTVLFPPAGLTTQGRRRPEPKARPFSPPRPALPR